MMTRDNYLPQYTLDRLAGRVCNSLERFDRFLPETMWIRPIEYCLIVEQEPRNISTVIFQAMKNKQKVSEDIMDYNQFLTRMYMLLYYRHSQDKVYQTVVFPALITYMGIYAKEETLKGICKGINILQEEDRLVESALGKKPEDITPTTVPEIALVNDPYGPGIIVLDPQTGLLLTGNETIPEKPSPAAEEPDADAGETDGEEETVAEGALHQKVSFEFFLRLLEASGLKFYEANNTDLAELWHMVTGLSAEVFRKHCSKRKEYKNRITKKSIIRLNEQLEKLHIDITLET